MIPSFEIPCLVIGHAVETIRTGILSIEMPLPLSTLEDASTQLGLLFAQSSQDILACQLFLVDARGGSVL